MVTLLLCLQLHHVRGGSTPPSKLGREWEAGGELMKKSWRETKKNIKLCGKTLVGQTGVGRRVYWAPVLPKLGMKSKVSKKINTYGKIDL
jgi:hypothetical protein